MNSSTDIKVTRKTSESEVTVILNREARDPAQKAKLNTPLQFFNHMLEHIAWRSETNLDIRIELDHFHLAHLITEDVGITLGKAFRTYIQRNADAGIVGYGSAIGIIDEAMTRAVISFESRALLDFTTNGVVIPEETEGMNGEDLVAFFEGFVQGAQCTLHIDVLKGRPGHGHHIWESAFRALGMALYEALTARPWRKGITAGVAGQIQYVIE
ncbi:MAG: hypothetical protein K6T83_18075 [Alicyclobacillus sp.]|nr:hypothetical protein [Alicyclobacillus sp.]